MSGPLYSLSTMMMARARLSELADLLDRKMRTPGRVVTDLEHRVHYLASTAARLMSSAPMVTDEHHRGRLVGQLAKFAVLGSSGTGITAAADIYGPGRDWIYDTLRKGTPDEHRERVLAGTTDFAFALWRELDALSGRDAVKRERYQAFALGYLCHIAGAALASPFLDEAQARIARPAGAPRDALVTLDIETAASVLHVEDEDWQALRAFWPTPDEVPGELWGAVQRAFVLTYGSAPVTGSPTYERSVASAPERVPLSEGLLADSYEFYYHGVIGIRYGFDFWSSWWFTVPAPLTLFATLGIAPAFRRLRLSFGDAPWDMKPKADSDETENGIRKITISDLFAYPLLMSAPLSLFYAIVAMCFTKRGAGGLNGWALAAGIVNTLILIAYLIVAGEDPTEEDFPVGWRWALFVGLPLLPHLIFFIVALSSNSRAVSGLAFLHAAPLFFLLACAVLYWLLLLPNGVLAKHELGANDTELAVEYVILALLAAAGLTVLWVWAAHRFRDLLVPEMADAEFRARRSRALRSPIEPDLTSFVRLYDEDALFRSGAPSPLVARADEFFPPELEPLFKLWWTPEPGSSGDLRLLETPHGLRFTDGGANAHLVAAPVGRVTVGAWVDAINALVPITVGTIVARLHAELDDPSQRDRLLTAGATLGSIVDVALPLTQGDAANPTTAPDDANTVWHAPREQLAVRYGRGGPARASLAEGQGTVRTSSDVDGRGADVTGTGTSFREFFREGDAIAIDEQIRYVTYTSGRALMRAQPGFSPDFVTDRPYARPARESLITMLGGWGGGGLAQDSVIHHAADLAAMLCMAMVPTLVPSGTIPRLSSTPGGNRPAAIKEVFRNWNLDRRRVNEWRMIVAGNAAPEDAADAGAHGAAPAAPTRRAAYPEWRREAAGFADRFGWVATLRNFVDLVARGEEMTSSDAPRPDTQPDVTPERVTRALAHLLDLPEPTGV